MGSAAAAHPTPGGTCNTGGLLPHGVIVSGFYTQEVRGGSGEGERLGFDIVTLDGSRAPLSRTSTSSTAALSRTQLLPSVGKYSVYTQSFEALALPALLTNLGGQQNTPRLVIIDEVGAHALLRSV
jgi:nucleoside-triphosphatase